MLKTALHMHERDGPFKMEWAIIKSKGKDKTKAI